MKKCSTLTLDFFKTIFLTNDFFSFSGAWGACVRAGAMARDAQMPPAWSWVQAGAEQHDTHIYLQKGQHYFIFWVPVQSFVNLFSVLYTLYRRFSLRSLQQKQ